MKIHFKWDKAPVESMILIKALVSSLYDRRKSCVKEGVTGKMISFADSLY